VKRAEKERQGVKAGETFEAGQMGREAGRGMQKEQEQYQEAPEAGKAGQSGAGMKDVGVGCQKREPS
jgi:hypothetical protein